MTHNIAESIMCGLALELFPGLSHGYSLENMQRMCEAYTLLTGRKATPKLNGRGYYVPELAD